jgi:hypothetical protein
MKNFKFYILNMAILVVAMCFYGMKPVTNLGYVEIDFQNYVGENPLVLDSVHYKNALGQDFTVTKFKYYVGDFKLYTKDGLKYERDDYFLVNAEELKSRKFALTVIPGGDYISMSFTLGVDSADNCSGAQTGTLDPVNGMFWTWNTGYVFVKMEGKAAASKSPGNIFEYHIGGYKAPANCIRHITLDLKNNPLKIRFERSSVLEIKADALEMLKTPMVVDFSKLSSVTEFDHAVEFADNYKDMFSVLKVINE